MIIKSEKQSSQHLSYCSNIHPGETWQQTKANLTSALPEIRAAVASGQDFGVGLRLSAQAASELAHPEELAHFQAYLEENPFYVFTLNGFPYGPFHGTKVKEAVYKPDWLNPERLRYTNALADLLASLLPNGINGSISTVPGAFKTSVRNEDDVQIMAHNMIRHVAHLISVQRNTEKRICLALEPEPCCFLETIDEVCVFFQDHLYSRASRKLLSKLVGISDSEAEQRLHDHLTVCLDVCHAAVEFEDVTQCLSNLRAAECAVGKLQISSGLVFSPIDANTKDLLTPFEDNVYLHQVVARKNESLTRYTDLHHAFTSLEQGNTYDEWRVHFHVPVFLDEFGVYQSTQFFLREMLAAHNLSPISEHLEIETYTWGVLPDNLKTANMQQDIIREFQWVLTQLD